MLHGVRYCLEALVFDGEVINREIHCVQPVQSRIVGRCGANLIGSRVLKFDLRAWNNGAVLIRYHAGNGPFTGLGGHGYQTAGHEAKNHECHERHKESSLHLSLPPYQSLLLVSLQVSGKKSPNAAQS